MTSIELTVDMSDARHQEHIRAIKALENPYLDAYHKANKDQSLDRFMRRGQLVIRYAWAVPDKKALDAIAGHAQGSGVVEPGCGTGYWAAMLQARAVDIAPYDLERPTHRMPTRTYCDIERGDNAAQFVAEHAERMLFLCWPGYDESFGADMVEAYLGAGGQRIAFVGESKYGCTGDERLFELLSTRTRRTKYVEIPQWDGLHDQLSLHDAH